jgi:murein DD-endopeptidase MepM/ murein hydrolase activator NlpD
MNISLSKESKNKRLKLKIVLILVLIILVPLLWYAIIRLEGKEPVLAIDLPSSYIGKSRDIAISVSDPQSGIRKLWVGLLKDGKEATLLETDYPTSGISGKGQTADAVVDINVKPAELGFSDGDAILRVAAWDYSWRSWLEGNKTYIEKNVTIDTRPPKIEVLTSAHNISQGGAGLVIYKLSEPCPQSGVYIGDRVFPGYSGIAKDANVITAFVSLGYDQSLKTEVYIYAADRAGNEDRAGINHYLKRKRFRKDVINLSDKFLNWKMPEFSDALSDHSGADLIDKFLSVNRNLRQANFEKIQEVCSKTDAVLHWRGKFMRLPRSAPRAGFGDQRTYKYQGKVVDKQIHLGVDLASLKHSQVPAANNGVVVYADSLGIYGNTVIIDHGFGLFSMYSHLNQIAVSVGQKMSTGDVLGQTGVSGLAGGDHLHFSVIVHNSFVNPIEWWDAAWIKNNISAKIDTVKARFGQE